MNIRMSAVVATRNRATYLRKALKSLSIQTLGRELFEIVVVDDGSGDNTSEVISEYSGVSNLRHLYEPVMGVSRARNTGWCAARGEYVVFMDDDAVAHTDWLEMFCRAFESAGENVGSIGGRAEPLWEAPRRPLKNPAAATTCTLT